MKSETLSTHDAKLYLPKIAIYILQVVSTYNTNMSE